MRLLITGATGFIGKALVRRLRADGHEIVAWVRSPARAGAVLGDVRLLDARGGDTALETELGHCQSVLNLAGESIAGGRWTPKRRRALVESRLGTTIRLVEAMRRSGQRHALVQASAVGFYGDRGEEIVDEGSASGAGFLADLCRQWEAAARAAETIGTRVVILRQGVALGRGGGALSKMLLPFRLGLGGPIGAGRQFLSWIHLDDLVEIWRVALTDDRHRGVINATSPFPVTNREFAKALGRALRRPTILPIPAAGLRLLLGEASSVLIEGQRVRPGRLERLGFRWSFPTLETAFSDLLAGGPRA